MQMNKFGQVLTDRLDGKKAIKEILESQKLPKILDFSGVFSLGSSFGDEVLPVLAKENANKITIKNANAAIRDCISKIVEDSGIEVEYIQ